MHFILRQLLPPNNTDKPIEIHITKNEVRIGRKTLTVLAKFAQISREHATLYKSEDDVLIIRDLKSLNGIYVNDNKISPDGIRTLKIGDNIGFGVTCDQKETGFVCVVCVDKPNYKIKQEVIDLIDSDDDMPQIISKPVLNNAACHIPLVPKNEIPSNYTETTTPTDFNSKTISASSSAKNIALTSPGNSKGLYPQPTSGSEKTVGIPRTSKLSVPKQFGSNIISANSEEVLVDDDSPNEDVSFSKNIALINSGNPQRTNSQSTSNKTDVESSGEKNIPIFSTIPLSEVRARFGKTVTTPSAINLPDPKEISAQTSTTDDAEVLIIGDSLNEKKCAQSTFSNIHAASPQINKGPSFSTLPLSDIRSCLEKTVTVPNRNNLLKNTMQPKFLNSSSSNILTTGSISETLDNLKTVVQSFVKKHENIAIPHNDSLLEEVQEIPNETFRIKSTINGASNFSTVSSVPSNKAIDDKPPEKSISCSNQKIKSDTTFKKPIESTEKKIISAQRIAEDAAFDSCNDASFEPSKYDIVKLRHNKTPETSIDCQNQNITDNNESRVKSINPVKKFRSEQRIAEDAAIDSHNDVSFGTSKYDIVKLRHNKTPETSIDCQNQNITDRNESLVKSNQSVKKFRSAQRIAEDAAFDSSEDISFGLSKYDIVKLRHNKTPEASIAFPNQNVSDSNESLQKSNQHVKKFKSEQRVAEDAGVDSSEDISFELSKYDIVKLRHNKTPEASVACRNQNVSDNNESLVKSNQPVKKFRSEQRIAEDASLDTNDISFGPSKYDIIKLRHNKASETSKFSSVQNTSDSNESLLKSAKKFRNAQEIAEDASFDSCDDVSFGPSKYDIVKLRHNKIPETSAACSNQSICDNNKSFVKSIQPMKKISSVQGISEDLSVKECSIYLGVKCDSNLFKWPSDVKKPVKENSTHSAPQKYNRPPDVKKPVKENSTHSAPQKYNKHTSLPSDENLNMNFHKSAVNVKNNEHNNIEHKNEKHSENSSCHKRKYPFNSHKESLMDQLHRYSSSSKKPCLANVNDCVKNSLSYDSKKYQPQNSKESESDSEGEMMNYSQVEDVIFIDDDDEYLDFNVRIKTEPPDIDDNLEEVNCIENLDVNNEFQDLMSDNDVDNVVKLTQGDSGSIETIESIKTFVSKTEKKISRPHSNSSKNTSVGLQENKHVPQNVNSNVDSNKNDSDIDDYPEMKSPTHVSSNVKVRKSTKLNVSAETKKHAGKNNFHLNKNEKECGKNKSKILLIDAQPLQYRPRKMRGRDEKVDRNKAKTSSSAKKKKHESPKKESISKLADSSKLKNFKIPRKQNKESDDHSAKTPGVKHNRENDDYSSRLIDAFQSPNATISSKYKSNFSTKSPTVKVRPHTSTSRMGFLMQDVGINQQNIRKPVAVVEAHRKNNITPRTLSQNVSINQTVSRNIPNTNIVQHTQHKPEQLKNNVNVVPISSNIIKPNPRDPRQNRPITVNPSNVLLQQNCRMRKDPSLDERNSLSNIVSSNAGYRPGNVVASGSKNVERPVSHSAQNVNCNKAVERSLSFPSQDGKNKTFERPIQTKRQNDSEFIELRSKLIKDLLYLNTKWLEEQSRMKVPPTDVSKGAAALPLKYDSFNSYVSSFYPMLKLEIWEQMYTESKEIFESKKHYNKFFFSILSYTSKTDLIELKCEAIVNEKVCFSPCEGCLTILELKESQKRINPVFGYIFKHRIEPLNLSNLKLSEWKSLPSKWITDAKHWTFSVYMKKKEMTFALDSLMKGNGLCYIRNKLRLLDALTYLGKSPLLTDFLQPNWNTFFVKYSAKTPTREFNAEQTEVIECVTSEIDKSGRDQPKIVLLQGPPGTGKTHTIIGLIQKFLTKKKFNRSYKILVTAPSNAAIDEIGCRLIDLAESMKASDPTSNLKFVRVGLLDQIHPKMKPYSLDRLANAGQRKKDIEYLTSEIAKLKREAFSRDVHERLKYLEERLRLLTSEKFVNQRDIYADMHVKQNILKDCNIVLSTLSGCGLSALVRTFNANSNVQFSYCIVDESTQCTELEILQPLILGVKKLIFVGDHKQLPATVLSKTACKYGFQRSAPERFHTYFEKNCRKTPMFTLKVQYRMHSSICEFPSKFFYDHRLITNPNVDLEYANFPVLPYMMLDIYVSQETDDSSSKCNSVEAQVIINVCTVLLDCRVVDSASSIGIITPYQAQRSLYMDVLNGNPKYRGIEVNTVDSFQGREKDVVIISTVRANSQSGGIGFLACKRRLNVAITRAKKCLIICVHGDSLMNYDGWRELISDAKDRNVCFAVTGVKDIPNLYETDMRKKKLRS